MRRVQYVLAQERVDAVSHDLGGTMVAWKVDDRVGLHAEPLEHLGAPRQVALVDKPLGLRRQVKWRDVEVGPEDVPVTGERRLDERLVVGTHVLNYPRAFCIGLEEHNLLVETEVGVTAQRVPGRPAHLAVRRAGRGGPDELVLVHMLQKVGVGVRPVNIILGECLFVGAGYLIVLLDGYNVTITP